MPRKTNKTQKEILVYTHWQGMKEPVFMGSIFVAMSRGKEIFSFEYDNSWLESSYAQLLDPDLALFTGPQYTRDDHDNFGLFLDSSPDRWGRLLMQRREAQQAKKEKRAIDSLVESDYLLGVYDAHRMGALRFRLPNNPEFLDNQEKFAAPPWTKLRDLEHASLQLENDNAENENDYLKWLNMLIAPGGSLGGARPKASVIDPNNHPWIAKFPSKMDEINIGKWEYLVHLLAKDSKILVSQSEIRNFSGTYDCFLTKRFDRTKNGERLHFASAMTLLGKKDGDNGSTGVSYLDLADFIIRNGAQVKQDLEQLWRRIIFYICTSNADDHLRNHGFILTNIGWILSPAYDINPVNTARGLSLNISKYDNQLDLNLALTVAYYFRLEQEHAKQIITEVQSAVRNWSKYAKKLSIPSREINIMQNAFRLAE